MITDWCVIDIGIWWAFVLISVGLRRDDHEHRLIKYLFSDYNSEVRPVLNHTDPVLVQFDLAYSQLVSLVCI